MEMETASSSEAMSKKLWKIVRAVLTIVKKSFAKSKFLVDLTLLLKHRTHKLTGKAFHSLLLTSVAPHSLTNNDYEFSCTNSPFFHFPKRTKSLLHLGRSGAHHAPKLDEAATMAAVQRVLEMINNDDVQEAAPRRQLRITDSPFPVRENNAEETVQVNKAADDFINKFYRDLLMQKNTPIQSPYHDAFSS